MRVLGNLASHVVTDLGVEAGDKHEAFVAQVVSYSSSVILDIASGTYTVISGTTYEAEKGTLSGSAVLLTDSSFSGGEAVGYLGMRSTFSHRPEYYD